jgi:hypothetical protein
VQILDGLPNDEVNSTVDIIKASPRYISHIVLDNGNGTSRVIVTTKKG